jgi:two-component system, cell cycle sensor histidine kinase and response regulator CckA
MATDLNPGVGRPVSARESKTKFASGWIWLATALGVATSFGLYLMVSRAEERRDDAEFNRQIANYVASLQERRNGSEDLLRILRSLFHQNPKLSRQLFTNTMSDLEIRMDGVQTVGWAPRVTNPQRAQFEHSVQQEGFPDFQIREGGLVHAPDRVPARAGERPEYFPLVFFDPMPGNEIGLGYDLGSVRAVHDLFAGARELADTLVSAPLPIPYRGGVQTGVLAVLPVFSPDYVPVKERRALQLQGYVIGVFIIDELMKAIESRTGDLQLDVEMWDLTKPGNEQVMNVRVGGKQLDSTDAKGLATFRNRPHLNYEFNIGERKIRLVFRRSDTWEPRFASWAPAAVLGVGLLLTGILAQFLRAASARAHRIEAVVHLRTTELAQANTKLRDEARDRLEAQNQLACERNLLYLLLNQLPDAVYVVDREGRLLVSNDAYARLAQPLVSATPPGSTAPQTEIPSVAAALSSGSTEVLHSGTALLHQETVIRCSEQYLKHFDVSKLPFRDAKGEIDGLLIIARDVTETKKAATEKLEFARRLQETQKLESLGILAGGIAHDFNNLLTTILGNANLAGGEMVEGSMAKKCLQRIEAASIRAANLCKQMLAYSGKGHFIVRRLDLGTLVEQTIELLRSSIQKKAILNLNLAPGLPPVMADATQLQQILMNLVINAADAIGERGGSIRINTGIARVDHKHLSQLAGATEISPGDYVFLEVSDDGCGMSPETRARVFDPFFTTKFTGRGLGLAAVLGIVRGHHGAISVHSELGRGTTFKLLLPKADGPIDVAEPPPRSPKDRWGSEGGLLLVDDEEEVRSVTSLMLQQAGFAPELAVDGREAVEKFQASPNQYRAVLLDLTMPRLDGVETLKELRRIHPEARILLMSGFSPKEVIERFDRDGPDGFIQKPFTAKDLLEALRCVLEESPRNLAQGRPASNGPG